MSASLLAVRFQYPDKLAQQVKAVERAAPNMKACATEYILHKGKRDLTICPSLQPGQFQTEILNGCTISLGATLMIDRLVFDAVGPFDENLNRLEYWDWLLRFAELCDIAFISKPLADIYVTMWAEASLPNENVPTLKSIRTIANKHLPGFRGRRGIALRQFRSTLFLETAPPDVSQAPACRRNLQCASVPLGLPVAKRPITTAFYDVRSCRLRGSSICRQVCF